MKAASIRGPFETKSDERKISALVHPITATKNAGGNAASPPICESEPYPWVKPGQYDAWCIGYDLCPVRRYKRTSLRLDFQLTCEPDKQLAKFVNMGQGKGEKRGRSSDFYRLWVVFNGDLPRKGHPMRLDVFKGKFCVVEVGDVSKDAHGSDLPDVLKYSVVRNILSAKEP